MRSITYLSVLAGLALLPADFAQAQRHYRPNYGNDYRQYRTYRPNFDRSYGQYPAYRSNYYPSQLTPNINSPIGLTRPETIEAAIRGYYIDYLGREPEPSALATWANHAYNVASLREVRVGILASPEYFNRAGGDPVGFVQSVFRDVTGRSADRRELNYWVDHFHAHRGDRAELVREILATIGE